MNKPLNTESPLFRHTLQCALILCLAALLGCDEPERTDSARLELVNGRAPLLNWTFQAPVTASEIQTFLPAADLTAANVNLTEPSEGEGPASELPIQILGTGTERQLLFNVPGMIPAGAKRRFLLDHSAEPNSEQENVAVPTPPKWPNPVEVTRKLNRVIVRNQWYEVVHDRALGGGVISVKNQKGGSVIHLQQADELKLEPASSNLPEKTFKMARDTQPEITIEKGPLCVKLEVRVRFIGEDGDRERAPTAIYQYYYFSTLPLIKMRVILPEQAVAQPFPVANLFKFIFKGRPFDRFLVGDPPRTGTLSQGGVSFSAKAGASAEWGFLQDGFFALGVTGPQLGGVYTGPTYQYLNTTGRSPKRGESWGGRYFEWSGHLYAGPANQAASYLRAVNDYHLALDVRDFATIFATVETKAKLVGNPAVKTVIAMLLAAARDRVENGRELAHAEQLIRYAERLTGNAPADDPVAIHHGAFIAMANEKMGILFKKNAGNISLDSIFHAGAEHPFLTPTNDQRPIWNLKLIDITNRHMLSFASYEVKARAPSLRKISPTKTKLSLSWKISLKNKAGSVPVRMSVTLERGAPTSKWRIYVAPEFSQFALWNIDFPFIGGVSPRFNKSEDYLAVPDGMGARLESPSKGSEYAQYYPGQANMQFIAYWQNDARVAKPASGLYLATLDRNATVKRFIVHPWDGKRFDAYVQHPAVNMGLPGNSFEMNYDCEIGVFNGDWHDAAKRYRQWALKQKWAPKPLDDDPLIPEWVKTNHLSLRTTSAPEEIAPSLKILQQSLQAPSLIDWEAWTTRGHAHAATPDSVPTPTFTATVEDLSKTGLHNVVTFSPMIWNIDAESWRQDGGMNGCCRDFAQNLRCFNIGDQQLAIMCANSPIWKTVLLRSVSPLFETPGVDGVFAHLAGTDAGQLCQATGHGHPIGGGHHHVDGVRSLLKAIRHSGKAKNPEFALLLDGQSECYLDVCDSFLTEIDNQSDLEVVAIPMFQAVYGDRSCPFGVKNATLTDHPLANLTLAQMFAYGSQLGRFHPEILLKNRERFGILKMLSDYQNLLAPWLTRGEMLKPPPVEYVDPPSSPLFAKKLAVVTSAWKARDGSLAFVLVNAGVKTPATVILTIDPNDYGLSNPDENPVHWSRLTPEGETSVATEDGRLAVKETIGDFGVLAFKATP